MLVNVVAPSGPTITTQTGWDIPGRKRNNRSPSPSTQGHSKRDRRHRYLPQTTRRPTAQSGSKARKGEIQEEISTRTTKPARSGLVRLRNGSFTLSLQSGRSKLKSLMCKYQHRVVSRASVAVMPDRPANYTRSAQGVAIFAIGGRCRRFFELGYRKEHRHWGCRFRML